MSRLGCHLSASGGFSAMGRDALSIGADTFQCFLRNPRGGRAKAVPDAELDAFSTFLSENSLAPFVAHAPYTLNACSSDPRIREFARLAMREDLDRMERLPGNFYNLHPGSHVGQGAAEGVRLTAALLDELLRPEQRTVVLLETMAGQGTEIGGSFEELADILSRAAHPELLGVCLDTCHAFAAGYDLAGDTDGVLTQFDKVIGLSRLRAVHLNDSQQALGSRRDRHARIGEGQLGTEALVRLLRHPALNHVPFILETPNELSGHGTEIALLRSLSAGVSA